MIIWVAGWPRCGTTLCRTILLDCFGLRMLSLYEEPQLAFLFGEDVGFGNRWDDDIYKRMRDGDEVFYIKTHNPPIDGSPAIYITRDGRDACLSLAKYWDISIRDAILGVTSPFASWSHFYYAWRPLSRHGTLFLRFEDMVSDADAVVKKLENIVGFPARKKFDNPINECRVEYPAFFQNLTGLWNTEMSDADLELFYDCHSDVMHRLGYMK